MFAVRGQCEWRCRGGGGGEGETGQPVPRLQKRQADIHPSEHTLHQVHASFFHSGPEEVLGVWIMVFLGTFLCYLCFLSSLFSPKQLIEHSNQLRWSFYGKETTPTPPPPELLLMFQQTLM